MRANELEARMYMYMLCDGVSCMVAASITHGCSLYHIRLQGHASHGVLVEAGGGGRLSSNRIHANGGAPLRHRRKPPTPNPPSPNPCKCGRGAV